jgi:hypothetical protein
MWRTWNTSSTWWHHALRVTLVAGVLFVSACTGPDHSPPAPSAHSPDGGHEGSKLSEDGDGGSGM